MRGSVAAAFGAADLEKCFIGERMANVDGRHMTAPEPWGRSDGPAWKMRRNSDDYKHGEEMHG